MSSKIRVMQKDEVKTFMEGDELCRLYVKTNEIVFGTSTLEPGKKGTVDSGHKNGEEIFYVAKGRVICNFPKSKVKKELNEGDIVIIPKMEPHELHNAGKTEALVVWSLAPPD
nr:cupin domain-containing protein [Candidatus Njordarchaeum guaymaensis]